MPAADIDFFRQIVREDPEGFTSRADWLRWVIDPAVRHLGRVEEHTVGSLELVLELAKRAELDAARRNWDAVLTSLERLADFLDEFAEYVEASGDQPIIDVAAKLARFFRPGGERQTDSGSEQALSADTSKAIGQLVRGAKGDAAATISAEILHMQLKWTILQNDCLELQAVPG